MIHQKIIQTSEERLGNLAIDAMKMAKSLATSPNGSASYTNADGTRTVLGAQNVTGSTMATHVGDTTPPGVPTGITASSTAGALVAAWDGTLTGGIPADFDHVTIYATSGTTTLTLGKLSKAGSVTSATLEVGTTYDVTATAEDDVCAIDGTPAHNVSAASAALSVTVVAAADPTADQYFWHDASGANVSATGDKDVSGFHALWTATKLAFLTATTELMTIGADLIELGKNSTSAVIKFCAGKLSISYAANTSGVDNATISSPDGILVTSEASTTAEYLHTLTTAEGNEGFLPAGTRINAYANVSPYDDKLGAYAEVMLDCTQPDGSENQMLISLMSGCRLNSTTNEPTVNLSMSTKDGSASATSYAAQMPFRRFITAIQPAMLYNGGAALAYDTAPGAGTNGTVTLSEDESHFSELTIQYTLNGSPNKVDSPTKTVTISHPHNQHVCLDGAFWATAQIMQFRFATILVSGTSLIVEHGGYANLQSNTAVYCDPNSNNIYITRVEGRM